MQPPSHPTAGRFGTLTGKPLLTAAPAPAAATRAASGAMQRARPHARHPPLSERR